MVTIFSQVDYPFHAATKTFLLACKIAGTEINLPKAIVLDGLVRDLHGEANSSYTTYNVWAKYRALYPFVGGTADAHKFNLINPVDSDAAYRMTFYGSPTHDYRGCYFAGPVGQYAETHCWIGDLNPSGHLAYYAHYYQVGAAGVCMMGDYYDVSGANTSNNIDYRGAATTTKYNGIFGYAGAGTWYPTFNMPDYATVQGHPGLIVVNRTIASEFGSYLNHTYATQAHSNAGGTYGTSSNTIKINKGLGTAYYGVVSRCAFASIGEGFTSSELTAIDNAVQAYQTKLGRNV